MYIHDNGKIIDEVVEHDNNSVMSTTNMAYGTNCPVIVDSKYDGIVLLPERSCSTTTTTSEEGGGKGGAKTFHYTVMIYMTGGQSRYEFGVEAHRIKYRKVVPTTTTVAIGEELLALQDADAVVATPNHATVANGAVQPTIIIGQAKKKTVVPSSITVEADNNNKRKCDEMDESSPLTITPPMRDDSYHDNVAAAHSNAIVARSIEEYLHKHETNCSNVSSEGVNVNTIVMTLPEWIQHNQHRQQVLFCEFKRSWSSTDSPLSFFLLFTLLSFSLLYTASPSFWVKTR